MDMIIAALFALTVLLTVIVDRRHRNASARQQKAIATLQQDLAALTTAGVGVGGHVARLERQLGELVHRQEQLEASTRVEHSYHQAIRLVSEGADTEQLIEDCGLVRDEAQLLQAFYGRRKAS